ncbi:MAG: hypothetical protein EU532_00285 [Promethearchaeota archaeon]|nr:MAG: hypothetical protein EU532_00285 [Candidatus Lokiarchaeota archaeon]
MTKSFSEDTLILNALSPGITSMTAVYSALTLFTNLKKDGDTSSRFNIIFFQEDGPNYLENFTLNPEYIIMALKSLEPAIVKGNVGGGIFLGIAILIDVFKKISEKSFRLIILTDSGTPKISKLYLPVLETMIDQIKNMPFFMDIIRIDIEDLEEDTKLMKLAGICNGSIYRINNVDSLPSILEILALKREVSSETKYNSKQISIPKENQQFYINLAEYPIELTRPETCSICGLKDYNAMVKCPNCGIVAHKICWALWTEESTIGIPHIFRCHNCYNLIKLEKDFIEKVKLAKKVKEAQILPQKNILDIKEYLESLETQDGPKIVHIHDPMGIPSEEFIEEGYNFNENREEEIATEDGEEVRFILCPHCFKMITNQYKRCPNCHRILKN